MNELNPYIHSKGLVTDKKTVWQLEQEMIDKCPEIYKSAMRRYLDDQEWDEEKGYVIPTESELLRYWED